MVDVREMYAEQIDSARLASSRGDRVAAAESYRAAIDVARGDPGLERELAPALVHLGKLEQELGHPSEAERLFHEALESGERSFGPDHHSLAVALNELGRLHIRRSHHVRAEPVLERLLTISRAKGEEHPDVATALAGLAVVRRALGDDAAAERGFRDALRIREKVLAPQHMGIVVTLEQLADTCADRGNRAEALALLQRALYTREAALGADHATVRALRLRISALELRDATMADDLAGLHGAPIASVESDAEPASPIILSESAPRAELLPFPVAPRGRRSRTRRRAFYAAGGLAAAALLITALVSRSTADRASDEALARAEAEQRIATSAATSAATMQLLAPTARAETRTPDSATSPALPDLPAAQRLSAIKVPVIVAANVDSMVNAATKVGTERYADQIGTAGGLRASPFVADANGGPPVLIGRAPVPQFPEALRSQRTEGAVVVRFRVDERGLVDPSSMKVVKSDHELLTLAVRNVLPQFRFEPARSPAPESRARAEWVDFRAEFTARN